MSLFNDPFSGTDLEIRQPRCYESHPPLKMGKGILYGGSAGWPLVKDADIYISLQEGSTCGRISDPWEDQKVIEVQYGIKDQHAPTDVKRFKKLIDWACTQLQDGKRVHVGCIGGHGRTGLVASAIRAQLKHDTNAITWVRQHYCAKAVESASQVAFLVKHYGVEPVAPRHSHKAAKSTRDVPKGLRSGKLGFMPWTPEKAFATAPQDVADLIQKIVPEGVNGSTKTYQPMASPRCLWKARK